MEAERTLTEMQTLCKSVRLALDRQLGKVLNVVTHASGVRSAEQWGARLS